MGDRRNRRHEIVGVEFLDYDDATRLAVAAEIERVRGGRSNGELARAVGTTAAVIIKWARAESIPGGGKLAQLAHALDLDPCALLQYDYAPEPEAQTLLDLALDSDERNPRKAAALCAQATVAELVRSSRSVGGGVASQVAGALLESLRDALAMADENRLVAV